MKYLGDVNYPDGSKAAPGQVIQKEWLVENNGSCDWTAEYRVQLMDAFSALGAESQQVLPLTRAGEQTTISISFTLPLEYGNYTTAWQAYSPGGEPFGDPIYMLIEVGP